MHNRKISSVAKTFQGKTVLLTGATGFLGKLVLEKLLRTCPKIKRIYIIVRAKKGKDHIQRRNDVLENVIFEPLKRNTIEIFEEKVEVIAGDLAVSQLGISPADQKKILEETNFVFHIAATVNFDEKIKKAVEINIKGTRDILKLAKQMKCLQGFVYISTAYSNCPRHEIEEKFYDPPYEVDKIINIVDSLDDDLLQYLTPKMLKDWPNTYVFTKSIAEHVVKTESDGLPLCIVRPSIVMSTYQEPLSGWAGNVFGAIGAVAAGNVGLIRTMWVKRYKIADIVPADFVVNCIISAAWDISNDRESCVAEPAMSLESKEKTTKIYNYVSGPENSITWGKTYEYTKESGKTVPSKACLWYHFFVPASTERMYKVYMIFLHIIPAYIVDFIAKQSGRKPQWVYTSV
ncbi:putative fatty acyl-CoA reductase CG5065 [Agrilus planipennis]|uniref:Fatty acyl-CoA reductase n=1 Tax=Agrilus planipennis TaxID=224129 RepID=A0A7F5RHE8_AGRPL|nr:putative fatty acyl-CoA reductase CG5065 [Agrilus planipennis]